MLVVLPTLHWNTHMVYKSYLVTSKMSEYRCLERIVDLVLLQSRGAAVSESPQKREFIEAFESECTKRELVISNRNNDAFDVDFGLGLGVYNVNFYGSEFVIKGSGGFRYSASSTISIGYIFHTILEKRSRADLSTIESAKRTEMLDAILSESTKRELKISKMNSDFGCDVNFGPEAEMTSYMRFRGIILSCNGPKNFKCSTNKLDGVGAAFRLIDEWLQHNP